MNLESKIYTVGHSSHSFDEFKVLLKKHMVDAIVDVRSSPYSSRYPHFTQSNLRNSLLYSKIKYVFLGKELGGRPNLPDHFEYGIANYEEMSKSKEYATGIRRVLNGAQKYNIALMCSEHSPLDCHRCLMVSRTLKERNIQVNHILKNGELRTQSDIEAFLLEASGKHSLDFFSSAEDSLNIAYKKQAMKVAYNELEQMKDIAL